MPFAQLRRTLLPVLATGLAVLSRGVATTDESAAHPLSARPTEPSPPNAQVRTTSSDWLALLPDGEEKRRFILDCTGCHQFDERVALTQGRARNAAEWEVAITKMLGFAGATTGFPVISASRDAATTALWLTQSLAGKTPSVPQERDAGASPPNATTLTEFPLPVTNDLPHDVAVNRDGRVVVTGMFTHQMYVLNPATRYVERVAIPVAGANPRAIEIDSEGDWWVVLGAPNRLARYSPTAARWRTYNVGVYPHSVALDATGDAWFNGHFTRDPEHVGRVSRAKGTVTVYRLPPHPELATTAGGPIPYEIRVAPDGRVWTSELQGNRLIGFDPVTGAADIVAMPERFSGPRRFDIDRAGILWIPAYATNELVRYDPGSRKFDRYPLPRRDEVPYVARVDDELDIVWVGTSASDAVHAFTRATKQWRTYPLPTRGSLVRHMAIDPKTHDLWAAPGAAPGGDPARVIRISPTRASRDRSQRDEAADRRWRGPA